MKHAEYQDEIYNYTVDECYNHPLWPKLFAKSWQVEHRTIDGNPKFVVVTYEYGYQTNWFWINDKSEISAQTALKTLLKWRYVAPKPTNKDRNLASNIACIFNSSLDYMYKANKVSELIAEYRESITNNANRN